MKKLLYVLLLAPGISPVFCTAQEIEWKSTTHWKLYNIFDDAAFRYPVDSLSFFKSIPLDDSTMKRFLKPASIWPKDKTSLWMGLFTASFETADNKTRKLIISSYGGFFYDSAEKRYYELPMEIRKEWYQFINDQLDMMNLPK